MAGRKQGKGGATRPAARAARAGQRGTARGAGAASRPGARPAPQQDRGQRRYEELLDAAEAIIAEVGVEAMTTNAVAERAGAGMGSLYHLFENRNAIVDALAQRYMRRMEPITAYAQHPELRTMPIASMVDAIVDPLVAFFRETPAYRHVFHAVNQPGVSNPGCEALHLSVVGNVAVMMRARVPGLDARRLQTAAHAAVELVHAMLGAAFEAPPAQRGALVIETKRLLALYSEMLSAGDDPLERLR